MATTRFTDTEDKARELLALLANKYTYLTQGIFDPLLRYIVDDLQSIYHERFSEGGWDQYFQQTKKCLQDLIDNGFPLIIPKEGTNFLTVHFTDPLTPENVHIGEYYYQLGKSTPGTLALKFRKYILDGESTEFTPSTVEEANFSRAWTADYFNELRHDACKWGDEWFQFCIVRDISTWSVEKVKSECLHRKPRSKSNAKKIEVSVSVEVPDDQEIDVKIVDQPKLPNQRSLGHSDSTPSCRKSVEETGIGSENEKSEEHRVHGNIQRQEEDRPGMSSIENFRKGQEQHALSETGEDPNKPDLTTMIPTDTHVQRRDLLRRQDRAQSSPNPASLDQTGRVETREARTNSTPIPVSSIPAANPPYPKTKEAVGNLSSSETSTTTSVPVNPTESQAGQNRPYPSTKQAIGGSAVPSQSQPNPNTCTSTASGNTSYPPTKQAVFTTAASVPNNPTQSQAGQNLPYSPSKQAVFTSTDSRSEQSICQPSSTLQSPSDPGEEIETIPKTVEQD